MSPHSKKNILLIIPNLDSGGAQNSFHKLSNELSKAHNIINVVFTKSNMGHYEFPTPLIDLEAGGSSTYLSKIITSIKRVSALKKIKKENKIDISISFLEGADYINILSKKKEKVIVSIRGSKFRDPDISGFLGWIRLNFLIPFLYKKADEIVTVSKGIMNELVSLTKKEDNIHVINNYYDVENIKKQYNSPIEKEVLDIPLYDKTIFAHSRLSHEKGFSYLIEVFSEVKKEFSQFSLLIVGDGVEQENLITLCKSYDLSVYTGTNSLQEKKLPFDVIFLGFQPNPIKYLQLGTIFALTSATEGFPNSLAEAMGCGKLCISTDCSAGVREILTKDYESFPEKIKERIDTNYGIILPSFVDNDSKYAIDVWKNSIIDIINNKTLIEKYEALSVNRISEFSKENAMLQWNNLIN